MPSTEGEGEIVAHFVPLSVIMAEHEGDLATYMTASGSRDVVVTMPVTMDVVGRGMMPPPPTARRAISACSPGCRPTAPDVMISASISMISVQARHCRTAWWPR